MEYPFYLYSIALAFLVWFLSRKKIENENLDYFGYLVAFNLIIENAAFYYSYFFKTSNHWIYNIITTLQIVLLVFLYSRILVNERSKLFALISVFLFPAVVVINFLLVQKFTEFHTYTYILGCFLMFFVSIQYLKQLFHEERWTPLRYQPFFWISIANILYYTTSIFYMGSINYIVYKNIDEYGELINLFVYFFATIQYCLYIIAFICTLKPKRK